MAKENPKPSEHLPIDRRTLLKTTVAITTATLAADVSPSEAAPVISTQPSPINADALLSVCATTARRLAEIKRRNELRREAKLPLLPIAKELRHMKEEDDRQGFSEAFGPFAAKHRRAVWAEILKPRREALSDPNWRPNWIAGMGYQGEVFRILRERFEAER